MGWHERTMTPHHNPLLLIDSKAAKSSA